MDLTSANLATSYSRFSNVFFIKLQNDGMDPLARSCFLKKGTDKGLFLCADGIAQYWPPHPLTSQACFAVFCKGRFHAQPDAHRNCKDCVGRTHEKGSYRRLLHGGLGHICMAAGSQFHSSCRCGRMSARACIQPMIGFSSMSRAVVCI